MLILLSFMEKNQKYSQKKHNKNNKSLIWERIWIKKTDSTKTFQDHSKNFHF